MKFFYHPAYSSDVVYLTLEELGISYDKVRVHFEDNHPSYEELKKYNHRCHVPTIVDGSFVLTEGTAIMRYLVESQKRWDLYPKPGTRERARCDEWLSFFSTFFQAQFWTQYVPGYYIDDPEQERKVQVRGLSYLMKFFDTTEARIPEGSSFLLGDQFTIADCYIFMIQSWSYNLELDLSSYPKFLNIVHHVYERESAKKILAEITDFYKSESA